MFLAADSLGLGTRLVTGLHARYSGRVHHFLEMKDSELLVCLVYLGYPDGEPEKGRCPDSITGSRDAECGENPRRALRVAIQTI